jgi:hypothetical protein
MEKLKTISLTILALIAGYAIMILGLYLSQDVTFGGIVIGETKLWQLVIAGIGAFISAFAGGYVATLLAPLKNYIPAIILAVETMIEATLLFIEGQFPNPLWFDIMSELTLAIGIMAGGYYYLRHYKSRKVVTN